MSGKKVIPADEHAAKIAAAREVIGDSDFFLVARTDARSTHGLAEAISRANFYLEAGADAIFVAGPRSDEDLKEIGSKINGLKACTMLEGGITPLHAPEELKEMGFHLVVYPFTSIYASARGMIDMLKTLKESGTTRDHLNKVTTFEEFNQLLDVKSCLEFEKRYSSFKKDV
ncbi:Carboxyvinyl-carboxyphosphonate phosphorylmutase [Actinidia chinensis var. chinensis]|uniref:Carboxyvinyl-carboxyphosphonate phosphorylmutase n=1 Tax=Actinidia chinensis var. chinensis TaxID=1590841 RepID=A0A2R6R2J8_ACTCC|nr:Carboxyvinyl-carboxyphosphonate phosphorylmutase [Actinidia chinensis var. chinensis]